MYEHELEVAKRAARRAAARIIELSGPGVDVRWKAENDPVTAADEAATKVILEHLAGEFPDDAVLIEERTDDLRRLERDRVWIVDPLDGTREFIDQIPEFCVMIGLVIRGDPVLGVVHIPLTGTVFVGVAGQGARMIDRDRNETALICDPVESIEKMRLVVSRSHRAGKITRAMQLLGITAEVPSGSVGVKVSKILTGEADLYIHLGPGIKLWDACAPDAIIRAAGGTMTDPAGQPIDYRAKSVHCPIGLLASEGTHQTAIADRIAPIVSELQRPPD
jgi:3'(2'), 5'-bisphosphate nucleotidase